MLAVLTMTVGCGFNVRGAEPSSTASSPASTDRSARPSPSSPTGPWNAPTGSGLPTDQPATPATTRAATSQPPVLPVPPPTQPSPTIPQTEPVGCWLPEPYLGIDVERLETSERVIALTFDAGASDDGVASILATLRETATPASFFFTGRFVEQFPDSARAIASSYPVGNHSMTHPNFTALTDAQVVAELDQARQVILAATGRDPLPWFRFPSGDRDARTIWLVNDQCYVPFRWTIDTLGWQGSAGGMSRQRVADRVLDNAEPGAIVLLHVGANPDDGSTLDADALPAIIDGLRGQGYAFVTLDYAVNYSP